MPSSRRAVRPASLLLLLFAALATPASSLAHAELTVSDPTNGSTVTGPLAGPVVITFSETLQAGSHAELLDPAGTKVADAAIDASNRARMAFTLASPLGPGKYTIQWTSVAADKDVARGQVTFTVSAPTPAPATPTPAPSVTAAPSGAPSAGATTAPTIAATAAPTLVPSGGSDAVIPIVAALALVLIVGVALVRRGRTAG